MEFSLLFGLKKTYMPLAITSDKSENWCFLIDTGATNNVIFSFVYEHFKDEFKTLEEKTSIMSIEGNRKEASIVEGTFNFGGVDYTSTFAIFDASEAMTQVLKDTGIQIHGILGTQFLIENGWTLDFGKFTVSDYKKDSNKEQ